MDSDLFQNMLKLVDSVIDSSSEIEDDRSHWYACNMCFNYMKTYQITDHRDDCPYVLALAIKKELDDFKNI